jgi:hypothetical protein
LHDAKLALDDMIDGRGEARAMGNTAKRSELRKVRDGLLDALDNAVPIR